MKKLIFSILFLSVSAKANITFNAQGTSDYVWRGVSQSDHKAAIQGGLDYDLPVNGLSVGTWTSNVQLGSEVDLYGKYFYKFSDQFALGAGSTFYYYTQNSSTNTLEGNLYFNTPYFSLSANYTGNYFGTKTSSFYYEITQPFTLDKEKKISLVPTIGYVTFQDKNKSQSNNYLNYRLEILKEFEQFSFHIFSTNTSRKAMVAGVLTDVDDESLGVAVSKSF